MKRRDLVRKLEELGCVLVRHGGSHATKKSQPVPRHNEIHEQLAKSIIRKLSKGYGRKLLRPGATVCSLPFSAGFS